MDNESKKPWLAYVLLTCLIDYYHNYTVVHKQEGAAEYNTCDTYVIYN